MAFRQGRGPPTCPGTCDCATWRGRGAGFEASAATVASDGARGSSAQTGAARAQDAERPQGTRARTWPLRHWLRCSIGVRVRYGRGRRGALRRVAGAVSLPELWPYILEVRTRDN
jgi:hypothetical protein